MLGFCCFVCDQPDAQRGKTDPDGRQQRDRFHGPNQKDEWRAGGILQMLVTHARAIARVTMRRKSESMQ
jgi:hypothetical protein